MPILYNDEGKKFNAIISKGISAKETKWRKENVELDGEEYELYRKREKLIGKRNYLYINLFDYWYKIEDNMETIFLGEKLYTSKFYRENIKKHKRLK